MLELNAIESGYGETQVLYGLSLKAQKGRVLAVLGRNGAGKSTTLKTIMGLLPLKSGDIVFDGAPIAPQPFDIAKAGIAYVPETRDIFPSLTVRENLELAAKRFGGPQAKWHARAQHSVHSVASSQDQHSKMGRQSPQSGSVHYLARPQLTP